MSTKWNKFIGIGAVLLLTVVIGGCAGKKVTQAPTIPQADTGEKLLWSSEANRPAWTLEEPATVNGVMSFVGLSGNFATEQLARDDARRNSVNNVVTYMGTLVKNKFEKASVSFGLESKVTDPTASSRAFEKQLAVNVAKQVKAQKWYLEKWQTPTGIAWRAHVAAQVPQAIANDTFKDTAKDMEKKAEQQAREASDEIAKKQAEKAAEFWKQMQDQGLTE